MENYYSERIESEESELKDLEIKNDRISNFRLGAIVLAGLSLYFLLETSYVLVLLGIVLILAGFYFLVKYHEKLQDEIELKKTLISVLRNELSICQGRENSYSEGNSFIDEKHDYSADLDVFGAFSLYHLMNRCKTILGQSLLSNSLLKPRAAEKIREDHGSSKELLTKDKWRQNFQASLFELSGSTAESLTELEEPPKIRFEGLIKYYAFFKWIFSLAVIGVFYYYGLNNGITALFILLAINFSLVGLNRKVTEPYFLKIKGLSRDMAKYKKATELILAGTWESNNLKNAYELLPMQGKNPIDEFQLISKKIDMKNNQFAAFFLYAFSPFDLVQLVYLRKWVKSNPNFFILIFESLAVFERLISVSTLAFNNPDWCEPEFEEKIELTIEAMALGHPLVQHSVCNDFELKADNRLSLITGSNMSGKSTFLRTLGSNVLLAYAGAPVFAKKFKLSTGIKLFAYMRIKDSLEQNSSTFKAEIDRIKILLEAMQNEPMALLLVDEMLRGTNSEDKLKGSLAFLEKVIKTNSFALVATHDLRMTEMAEKYPSSSKNYFFEYDSKDGELTFDYKLKPGICTSFNASELLRKVGLDV